jgi:tRNA A-37 threonylcarbamoyl transferase component Bud32
MKDQDNGDIKIVLRDNEVIKRYILKDSNHDNVKRRFRRELKAYSYFNSINIDFVPHLISYDESSFTLILEKVKGDTLLDMIEKGDISEHVIISGLVKIDRYLYRNRINYLHSSIKDIFYDRKKKSVCIIDFEYTYLNEYFQQILYDCMFGSRMMRIKNHAGRDKFLGILRERKNEFQSYYYRKAKNILLSKVGMLRKKD